MKLFGKMKIFEKIENPPPPTLYKTKSSINEMIHPQ